MKFMPGDATHSDGDLRELVALQAPGQVASLSVVLAAMAWVFAAYGTTTRSMIVIWSRSETFAHGFIVLPIVLYLLWRKRDEIATIVSRPFVPAIALLPVLGALWLVATRLGVDSVAQFAMVGMIPAMTWAALGTPAMRVLAFPLAFLFFAVPFGEFLIPTLMDWTADVTIGALRASGIPVYREGNFFTIPSGRWSVVEACSGLRYLIASFMVGCLFAYLSFRSAARRAIFVAASIAVPIVANWIRAYVIVMLGHVSGNRIAAGADHLVYGWVFFGVVMTALFLVGARWREDTAPRAPAPKPPVGASGLPASAWRTLAVAVALTAVFPVLAHLGARESDRAVALHAIEGSNGWNPEAGALSDWRPDVAGATAWQTQTFARDGKAVAVIVAYFDAASSAKAVTSTNQLVRTVNRQWQQVAAGTVELPAEARNVRSAEIVGNRQRLAVWQWYWVDGRTTASDLAAKFYQAMDALRGRSDPVAWVVLATRVDRDAPEAWQRLSAFSADMLPAIDAALRGTASPP
jgi:exosortase A